MPLAETIEGWMEEALDLVEASLQHQLTPIASHQVLIVTGWNQSAEMRQAIARYLVGLRINAINAALSVRAEIGDTDEDQLELAANVYAIIGEQPNSLTAHQKSIQQNPWIAEGIWHLCFAVARRTAALHPAGAVVAVNLPHALANDHGFDVAVLYRTGDDFGISVVESKAYEENVGNAIQNSIEFFREVDRGDHAVRIRQAISIMRAYLPNEEQEKISQTLWQERRCYVANPHYEFAHAPNWTHPRPALAALAPGPGSVFIMPHGIQGFAAFFEAVAAEMRAAVLAAQDV
jgi:hypothetical protein